MGPDWPFTQPIWEFIQCFSKPFHKPSSCVIRVGIGSVYPKKYAHGFCFAVLCCVYTLIFPYPSGLLHWHCGNLTIAPVPAKQPRWIWINTSCEFIVNDCITTTKQSTTKPCAYFLGYTVATLRIYRLHVIAMSIANHKLYFSHCSLCIGQ